MCFDIYWKKIKKKARQERGYFNQEKKRLFREV